MTMKTLDLRVSFLIAAAWLIGLTLVSLWRGPTPAGEGVGILNAFGPLPLATQDVAEVRAPKHSKLPIHWAHQRWGAV
ncbi:MAG: hypothetical protein ACHQF3_03020 [Alphaproteobacteria bacterium]